MRVGVNAEAGEVIAQLGLVPLPREGGFFRQSWVSPARLADGRAAASAIWYLLTPGNFSALHRLHGEERWHFFEGDPVEHVQFGPTAGAARVTVLGDDPALGHHPELVVPGGAWQGARLGRCARPRAYALVGCTVQPAWDEREFELGERAALGREFPAEHAWIAALMR